MSAPFFYAELLSHIRQITIFLSLSTPDKHEDIKTTCSSLPRPKNESSLSSLRVSVAPGRKALVVSPDNGDSSKQWSYSLPARVGVAANALVGAQFNAQMKAKQEQPQQSKSQVFSFRLPTDASEERSNECERGNVIPWSAKDFVNTRQVRVRCVVCMTELLDSNSQGALNEADHDRGLLWKDLPNADWAEMMELWHCHKPDVNHDHKHKSDETQVGDLNSTVKGYGASNEITCEPGTAFIDVSSFLLAHRDAANVVVSQDESTETSLPNYKTPSVLCATCGTKLGVDDLSLRGLRLFKMNVSVFKGSVAKPEPGDAWEAYGVAPLVSAQLLELMERTGVRRFVVYPGDRGDDEEQIDGVLLWLFNPDILYTTSSPATSHAHTLDATTTTNRALKILFRHLCSSQLHKLINPPASTPSPLLVENLPLPSAMYTGLVSNLQLSQTSVLPATVREVCLGKDEQEKWQAGLLERL